MPSSIYLSDFDYRLRCCVGAICRRIVWFSILLGEFHQALQLSYFQNHLFISTTKNIDPLFSLP